MLHFQVKPPLADLGIFKKIKDRGIIESKLYILTPYRKPPITHDQQLLLLKSRGLVVENDRKLLHLLKKINYYRLSGYCYPFLTEEKQLHIFKAGTTFEKIFTIYKFDRELRQLVVRELEKIEIAARAQIAHVLSLEYGDPFWYTDPNKFKKDCDHPKLIEDLRSSFMRSDAQFMDAYKKKYTQQLPPCWMILELSSFGTISMLYQNLKDTPHKRAIAEYFGLDKSTFTSWLHCFAYLRNVCAHHARLWNRVTGIQPNKPKNPKNTWLNNNNVALGRCFYIFSTLIYILKTVDPNNKFQFKLRLLFRRYKSIDHKALGFPSNWKKEPIWTFNPNPVQKIRLIIGI